MPKSWLLVADAFAAPLSAERRRVTGGVEAPSDSPAGADGMEVLSPRPPCEGSPFLVSPDLVGPCTSGGTRGPGRLLGRISDRTPERKARVTASCTTSHSKPESSGPSTDGRD